jgi:RNA polymerase sigma-70 factor (ECF subfamily)
MPPSVQPDFSEVFAAYHGKVLAYARKLLGAADAEDVTQEVFVKIDRALPTLEDPSKLSSWVYAITLNTVRDLARRQARTPDLLVASAESAVADGEAGDPLLRVPDAAARTPEETAMHGEMVACYLDYVRQLPPAYYEVYVLAELEQLGNEEIARRLALSLGTVKIRLHRARAQLHEALRRNCRCYHDERGELMGEPK